jgi:prepilin-type N-terminal cleavage/methylation domain-containing protein
MNTSSAIRRRLKGRHGGSSGFTLIEIVVVVALAGMILAGVLIAISAAQQSVRDSQRRAAVSQVESALEQWAATHSGSYAGAAGGMLTIADLYGVSDSTCPGSAVGPQYLDVGLNAPGGSHFTCPSPPYSAPTTNSQMSIADRDGGNTTNDGYCVRVKLEGGGNEVYGATDTNKSARNMTSSGCS